MFAEKLDRDNPDANSRFFLPLAYWISNLFEGLFNRNLFTTVEAYDTVAYNQVCSMHSMILLIDT
jgi:hypothetical protein